MRRIERASHSFAGFPAGAAVDAVVGVARPAGARPPRDWGKAA